MRPHERMLQGSLFAVIFHDDVRCRMFDFQAMLT